MSPPSDDTQDRWGSFLGLVTPFLIGFGLSCLLPESMPDRFTDMLMGFTVACLVSAYALGTIK